MREARVKIVEEASHELAAPEARFAAMKDAAATGQGEAPESSVAAEKTPQSVVTPTSWAEAKAQNPALMTWTDASTAAKREGRQFDIFDHLRDPERGLGRWANRAHSQEGLPLKSLHDIDKAAHKRLYNVLGLTDPTTGERNRIPDDLNLPKGGPRDAWKAEPTAQEVKAAQRFVRQYHRQKAKSATL